MTQRTRDILDTCIRVAREFGFPTLVLAYVMLCITRAAAVLHETVLIPIVDSHTTFLTSTTDTLKSLGRTQEQQAETLQEIAEGQREIHTVLGRINAEGSHK